MQFMIYAYGFDEQHFAYACSATEAIDAARQWRTDGLTVEISDRTGAAYPVERFVELHRNKKCA
jgi:hypothetical protein